MVIMHTEAEFWTTQPLILGAYVHRKRDTLTKGSTECLV